MAALFCTGSRFQHTAARRRLGPNIRHPTSPPPCFNTQPPEGGWYGLVLPVDHDIWFQHTAARRRLDFRRWVRQHNKFVSTHSRPKAAGLISLIIVYPVRVSTHSRPKAAGTAYQRQQTQVQFQHTAARRRLVAYKAIKDEDEVFQHTAARRRLGPTFRACLKDTPCFNTQPPEGGWPIGCLILYRQPVSTHSRPKAAGSKYSPSDLAAAMFQHTAARRRLVRPSLAGRSRHLVSTHSRPKAAGFPPMGQAA